jgi:hypothetical protein
MRRVSVFLGTSLLPPPRPFHALRRLPLPGRPWPRPSARSRSGSWRARAAARRRSRRTPPPPCPPAGGAAARARLQGSRHGPVAQKVEHSVFTPFTAKSRLSRKSRLSFRGHGTARVLCQPKHDHLITPPRYIRMRTVSTRQSPSQSPTSHPAGSRCPGSRPARR